jgi:hypothetical protein
VTLDQHNYTRGQNVTWGGPLTATYGADTLINDPPIVVHEDQAVWVFSVENPPSDLAWSICYAAAENGRLGRRRTG